MAMAEVAVKAQRAFEKAAKQVAQQGGSCPPGYTRAGPQTPAAPGMGWRPEG